MRDVELSANPASAVVTVLMASVKSEARWMHFRWRGEHERSVVRASMIDSGRGDGGGGMLQWIEPVRCG